MWIIKIKIIDKYSKLIYYISVFIIGDNLWRKLVAEDIANDLSIQTLRLIERVKDV